VDDAGVVVCAHDVEDRVGLADVRQELVAQPLALMRAADEAGDVVNLKRVVDDLGGGQRLGHGIEPRVAHGDDGDVGIDRGEGVVGGLGPGVGKRVEERALARVGQPDDPDLHRAITATAPPSAAPATTSEG
jgi:hypothetical protein